MELNLDKKEVTFLINGISAGPKIQNIEGDLYPAVFIGYILCVQCSSVMIMLAPGVRVHGSVVCLRLYRRTGDKKPYINMQGT